MDYASGMGVNDATVTGTLTYSSSSYKVGAGSMLTSTSAYFSLPTMTMAPGGFSLCMWYYFTGATNSRILEFSNAYSNPWFIYMGGTNNAVPYHQDISGSVYANGSITLGNAQFTLNTWYHIAMVCSPNNTTQAYINGVAGKLFTSTNYAGQNSISRVNNMLGYNYQFLVGFAAGYDDVRVYNGTVLTAAQVATIYAYV